MRKEKAVRGRGKGTGRKRERGKEREVKELAHEIAEAGKFRICVVGWQVGDSRKS